MNCKHDDPKKLLPLYARDQNSGSKGWISTKAICGSMIYACLKCNAITERDIIPKNYFKINIKKEVN